MTASWAKFCAFVSTVSPNPVGRTVGNGGTWQSVMFQSISFRFTLKLSQLVVCWVKLLGSQADWTFILINLTWCVTRIERSAGCLPVISMCVSTNTDKRMLTSWILGWESLGSWYRSNCNYLSRWSIALDGNLGRNFAKRQMRTGRIRFSHITLAGLLGKQVLADQQNCLWSMELFTIQHNPSAHHKSTMGHCVAVQFLYESSVVRLHCTETDTQTTELR